MVNNFPLSHVIFKVNFPLSNDPLALVSAKRQQQHFNDSLSQVDLELSWAMNSSVFNNLATLVSQTCDVILLTVMFLFDHGC